MAQRAPVEESAIQRIVGELVDRYGDDGHRVLDELLDGLDPLEVAAGFYDWDLWARPKQRPPEGEYRSWGFLTGRGYGKTRACSEQVHREVLEGRATRIALIAQSEDRTFEVMVDGDDGLIATSPPWAKAVWTRGRVEWPNGARAYVYTPERPDGLRGPQHDLAWASELIAWPASTWAEAWKNLSLGLRQGKGRLLWDSTPRKRHPLLRLLLERARKRPDRHFVVRGSTRENAENLAPEQLEEWEEEFGGTRAGDEELEGIFFDESDGACFHQAWIDDHRREMPTKLKRRILSVDPAISMRRGTDDTGISELGLGVDDQVHILADHSGRLSPEVWGELVVDRYVEGRCDCIVVERNRGGDLLAAVIRAVAKERGFSVVVLDKKSRSAWRSGVIYIREIVGREGKHVRAEPVGTLYEKGRVSHTNGVDLEELEDEMTTWEPAPGIESPNRLDAMVHGVWELAGLADQRPDHGRGMRGLGAARETLSRPSKSPSVTSPALERHREAQRRSKLSFTIRQRGDEGI